MVNRSSRKRSRNAAAVALGRLGGLKGGKARAVKLSAEERREIARNGAIQRWAKHNKQLPGMQDDFEIQRQRFQELAAARLASYQNQFVVSMNGRIVDSDSDLPTLTGRFFKRNPEKSVYITKIGGAAAIIGSPVLKE